MFRSRLSRLFFVASVIQLTTSQTLESLIIGTQIAESLGIIPSLPSPVVDTLQLINSGKPETALGTLNIPGLGEGSVLTQAVEAIRPARSVAPYSSSTYSSTNVLGLNPVSNSAVKVGTNGLNSVSNVNTNFAYGNLATANLINDNLGNRNLGNDNQVIGLGNIYSNLAKTLGNINQSSQNVASATNRLNAAVISTQEKPKLNPLSNNVVSFPLAASSGYSEVPLGFQVAANNLEIGGSVTVNGQMPFNGVVTVNGNVPTEGKGTVSQYFGEKKPGFAL